MKDLRSYDVCVSCAYLLYLGLIPNVLMLSPLKRNLLKQQLKTRTS